MIEKVIKGTDECYVCGKILKWESARTPSRGSLIVYQVPDITADITAFGKNEDGTVRFEILCKCPNCKTKNKFYRDVEV